MFSLKVIAVMAAGVLAGRLARKSCCFAFLDKSIFYTVLLLLFWMGVEVGGNPHVTRSLVSLGGQALLLAVAGTLGSVLLAKWVYARFFPESRPAKPGRRMPAPEDEATVVWSFGPASEKAGNLSSWKSTLFTLAAFATGGVSGYAVSIPDSVKDLDISLYILYALMLQVGMNIGSDPKIAETLRQIRPRLVLVPLATWIGTLSFTALASLLLSKWSLWDCLAVGSGFAYYSLSSILITELKGAGLGVAMAAELGVIALIANILREIITIVGAPLFVRCFGKLAPICAGGATTLDTTLPAITQACGKEWVFVSMFHAVLVDLSVPFLVSFFCGL